MASVPKTVLIVEDDEDTRTVYADALRERGYRVLTATQGAEGVHLARRHRPDLILLDIRMPVMDGRPPATSNPTSQSPAYRSAPSLPMISRQGRWRSQRDSTLTAS